MWKPYVILTAVMAAIAVAVLSCGLSRPTVEDDKYKTPTFDHAGVTSDCASCHEEKRPADPHPQGIDCSSCHAFPQWEVLKTAFNHQPAPDSCLMCHEKDRSTAATHPTSGDCVSCHHFPAWLPPKT